MLRQRGVCVSSPKPQTTTADTTMAQGQLARRLNGVGSDPVNAAPARVQRVRLSSVPGIHHGPTPRLARGRTPARRELFNRRCARPTGWGANHERPIEIQKAGGLDAPDREQPRQLNHSRTDATTQITRHEGSESVPLAWRPARKARHSGCTSHDGRNVYLTAGTRPVAAGGTGVTAQPPGSGGSQAQKELTDAAGFICRQRQR